MTQDTIFQGIDTIIIRVSDLSRSRQWYTENLGLTVLWEDPAMKLVVFDMSGTASITIWQTDVPINPDRDTASYPIFGTTDARAARQALLQKAVEVSDLTEDDATAWFLFYDPDGNVLEACQVL